MLLLGGDHAIDSPRLGQALQLMQSAVLEVEPGTRKQVLRGPRYEDFARAGEIDDARSDVDRQPTYMAPLLLHLTGVDAGSKPQVERRHGGNDGQAGADGGLDSVEQAQEAVARGG